MKFAKQFYPFVLLIIMFATLITLKACVTLGYDGVDIDTTRKAIVVANAELRAANLLVDDLLDRGTISPLIAQDALDELRTAHGALQKALNAVDVSGDPVKAEDFKLQATRAINVALQLLAPSNGDPE